MGKAIAMAMAMAMAMAIGGCDDAVSYEDLGVNDMAVSDLSPLDRAMPDLAPLVSTVSDCANDTHPCVTADYSMGSHTISPLLFGDGIEWTQYGENTLTPDGAQRPEVVAALKDLQLTLLRYPGGTLSDVFHWKGAIGPLAMRTPQATLNVDPNTMMPTTELPVLGPDEFPPLASAIGADILLTVNVGTGTAQEAADWITYWKGKGVNVKWVEIGNEMYYKGPGSSFVAMTPSAYASAFDAYAKAIHAVDPAIKLGVLGVLDTTFWCTPNCTNNPWNGVVMKNITEKADWMSVHVYYAPATDQDSQAIQEAMLSFPRFAETADGFIEKDIDFWAAAQNKALPLGVTEHSSFFVPSQGADLTTVVAEAQRNQRWSSSLFSALEYQVMLRDDRLLIANHINPLHYLWQAPITIDLPNFQTFPVGYTPNPRLSSFGQVFKAYREVASQKAVAATVVRSPTIDTQAVSFAIPSLMATPLVDAVAATGGGKGWLFVVNRSMTTDLMVSVVLKSPPPGATTLEVDQLTEDAGALATPPWTPLLAGPLPPGATFGTTLAVPKQSLVRLRLH